MDGAKRSDRSRIRGLFKVNEERNLLCGTRVFSSKFIDHLDILVRVYPAHQIINLEKKQRYRKILLRLIEASPFSIRRELCLHLQGKIVKCIHHLLTWTPHLLKLTINDHPQHLIS